MCVLPGSDEADSLALAVLTDEAHDQNRESSILRRGLRPQTEGRKRHLFSFVHAETRRPHKPCRSS